MNIITKARWLVILKNDKMFVTEDDVQPAELSLRLAQRGVAWKELCCVIKLPPNEPQVV